MKYKTLPGLFTAIASALKKTSTSAELLAPNSFVEVISKLDQRAADQISAFADGTITYLANDVLDGMSSILFGVFEECANLTLTSLPDSITSIEERAFTGCSKLALNSLPNSITTIGNNAFSSCRKLALTSLPSSLTSLGSSAFFGCTGLTTITFKGTPSSIPSSAFTFCSNLKTINVPWAEGAVANAPWGATSATINYNYKG